VLGFVSTGVFVVVDSGLVFGIVVGAACSSIYDRLTFWQNLVKASRLGGLPETKM